MIDPRSQRSDNEEISPLSVFVFNKEYLWWAGDHAAENYFYIKKLNTDFVRYKLNSISNFKIEDQKQNEYLKTMALRQLYVETLESFFASLFAFLESPEAIPIWLAKYTNRKLEMCVFNLNEGKNDNFPNLEKHTNIIRITDAILYDILEFTDISSRNKFYSLASSISTIIRHAILQYKSEKLIQEYNSIKHGHRANLGGSEFRISFDVMNPDIRPDTSTFHTLIKSDSGITFPIVRSMRKNNQIEWLSLEDQSATANNEKTAARIDALLRVQEIIYMAMSAKAGVKKDAELPEMRNSIHERRCWMPEKYEGSVQSKYNYNFSDSRRAFRGWGFDIDVSREKDPNDGIGAFATDDTDLILQHILTKTFASMIIRQEIFS